MASHHQFLVPSPLSSPSSGSQCMSQIKLLPPTSHSLHPPPPTSTTPTPPPRCPSPSSPPATAQAGQASQLTEIYSDKQRERSLPLLQRTFWRWRRWPTPSPSLLLATKRHLQTFPPLLLLMLKTVGWTSWNPTGAFRRSLWT